MRGPSDLKAGVESDVRRMIVRRPIADIRESLAVFVDDIDETAAAAVLAFLIMPNARSGFEGGAHIAESSELAGIRLISADSRDNHRLRHPGRNRLLSAIQQRQQFLDPTLGLIAGSAALEMHQHMSIRCRDSVGISHWFIEQGDIWIART
jgi:hypothetical protein